MHYSILLAGLVTFVAAAPMDMQNMQQEQGAMIHAKTNMERDMAVDNKQAADTSYGAYGKYGKYSEYGSYPGGVEREAAKMETGSTQ
ncbi:hypothetical protein EJ07DRAFT_172817 [Lizonia empirigonia]|nr:hypothetical protein EJ07DRAFT_172817 [Lizonia empirigonia]